MSGSNKIYNFDRIPVERGSIDTSGFIAHPKKFKKDPLVSPASTNRFQKPILRYDAPFSVNLFSENEQPLHKPGVQLQGDRPFIPFIGFMKPEDRAALHYPTQYRGFFHNASDAGSLMELPHVPKDPEQKQDELDQNESHVKEFLEELAESRDPSHKDEILVAKANEHDPAEESDRPLSPERNSSEEIKDLPKPDGEPMSVSHEAFQNAQLPPSAYGEEKKE